MSLIVAIGLLSSSAASMADTAVGEVALALALVVAIVRGLLAVIVALGFVGGVALRRCRCSWRVCSWWCSSLVDNGASFLHDGC